MSNERREPQDAGHGVSMRREDRKQSHDGEGMRSARQSKGQRSFGHSTKAKHR